MKSIFSGAGSDLFLTPFLVDDIYFQCSSWNPFSQVHRRVCRNNGIALPRGLLQNPQWPRVLFSSSQIKEKQDRNIHYCLPMNDNASSLCILYWVFITTWIRPEIETNFFWQWLIHHAERAFTCAWSENIYLKIVYENFLSKAKNKTFLSGNHCNYLRTSMHSSRMRTARLLTVYRRFGGGGLCIQGGLHLGGLHPVGDLHPVGGLHPVGRMHPGVWAEPLPSL